MLDGGRVNLGCVSCDSGVGGDGSFGWEPTAEDEEGREGPAFGCHDEMVGRVEKGEEEVRDEGEGKRKRNRNRNRGK